MNDSSPEPKDPLTQDPLRWLARGCGRKLQSSPEMTRFLSQPLHYQTPQELDACGMHILKLIAPLIRDGLNLGNRAVDCGESLSSGMQCVLQDILHRGGCHQKHIQAMVLHSMLPLYLALSGSARTSALSESIRLCREYALVVHLNELVESDLERWLLENGFPRTPLEEILLPIGLPVPELASRVWETHASNGSHASDGTLRGLSLSPLEPTRRKALWKLVHPWVSGQVQFAIPKELALDHAAWSTLREHFTQLCELMGTALRTSTETTSESETIDSRIEQIETFQNALQSELEDHASTTEQTIGHSQRDARSDELPYATTSTVAASSSTAVVEIRSSSDPKLASALEQQLSDCRSRQGTLTMVVVRSLSGTSRAESDHLSAWEIAFLDQVRDQVDQSDLRSFTAEGGVTAVLIEDLDRGTVTAIVREALQMASQVLTQSTHLPSGGVIPLIGGISFVSSPTRAFRLDQLTDAAWRCLDGAAVQGSGAVKSIEVF